MGCDIHILAEVKKDGKWVRNTDKVFKNPWYREDRDPDSIYDFNENEFEDHPSTGRNYDWFAILADVRNGRGFAGTPTGAGFDVVAEPRGIPTIYGNGTGWVNFTGYEEILGEDGDVEEYRYEIDGYKDNEFDCSPEWLAMVQAWGVDMHSHSYLYPKDFKEFDWNQGTVLYGIITLDEYKEIRGTGKVPDSWAGGVSGNNVVVISQDEADKVLSGELKTLTKDDSFLDEKITKNVEDWNIYVAYDWMVLYSDWFDWQIENVIKPLYELEEKYGDARIVFGFDN